MTRPIIILLLLSQAQCAHKAAKGLHRYTFDEAAEACAQAEIFPERHYLVVNHPFPIFRSPEEAEAREEGRIAHHLPKGIYPVQPTSADNGYLTRPFTKGFFYHVLLGDNVEGKPNVAVLRFPNTIRRPKGFWRVTNTNEFIVPVVFRIKRQLSMVVFYKFFNNYDTFTYVASSPPQLVHSDVFEIDTSKRFLLEYGEVLRARIYSIQKNKTAQVKAIDFQWKGETFKLVKVKGKWIRRPKHPPKGGPGPAHHPKPGPAHKTHDQGK